MCGLWLCCGDGVVVVMSDPQTAQPVQLLAAIHREQAVAQREQPDRLQDPAEHQMQLLVGITVPLPPPLLAVTMHRIGEGDNPQLFLETFQAMAERASGPQQNGRHSCCSLGRFRRQL